MSSWIDLIRSEAGAEAKEIRIGDWVGYRSYTDVESEYNASRNGVGLHDSSYRGLLEVTGADRLTWLHNLTTNEIANLKPGEGNYTFATNLKGKILFDMNVSVCEEALWLDMDRRWIQPALTHFEKYTIIEDVAVRDRCEDYLRLTLIGAEAGRLLAKLGPSNTALLPFLQVSRISLAGIEIPCFRHDRYGLSAADLLVPTESAKQAWDALRELERVTLVGYDAVDMLRLESGIPWPVTEISDQILPAETGQLDRAVSHSKGCYLGQEIIERMRSRESLARKLSLIRFDGSRIPNHGDELFAGGKPVGLVTSACHSLKFGAPISLAYLRTASADEGTSVIVKSEDGDMPGTVVPPQPPQAA